jgi:hypothetical protein
LRGDALSLFVTLVDELLLQDPDLEESRFEILDFSAPNPKAARDLVVTQARDVPRLGEAAKRAMLATFAEGFLLATAELAGSKTTPDEHEEARANRQPGLFD